MLAGNFSFAGKGVTANPLYDPLTTTQLANGTWTRTPIPGNIIPPIRIDPVAVKFFALTPWALPNAPGTYSNTGPSNNFQGTYLKKVFWENYTGAHRSPVRPKPEDLRQLDLQLALPAHSPNPQLSQPLFDSSLVTENDYQTTATLAMTKIISPRLINEARVGYYRMEPRIFSPVYDKNLAGLLGIPNVAPTLLPGGLPLSVGGPTTNINREFHGEGRHDVGEGLPQLQVRLRPAALAAEQLQPRQPQRQFQLRWRVRPHRLRHTDHAQHRRHQPGFLHARFRQFRHLLYPHCQLGCRATTSRAPISRTIGA